MADFKYISVLTLKEEGGLSNDKNDSASNYPSPYLYKGKKGWHTNKGITYKTFEVASKNLGFKNSYDNFIKMPYAIWYKIAKIAFWDGLRLDEIKSQSISNLLYSWNWAGGSGWKNRVQKYFRSKGIEWNKGDIKSLPKNINAITDKYGEKKVSDDLFEEYRKFYKSIGTRANPRTAKHPEGIFTNGWLNRVNRLQEYSNKFITFTKKNKGIGGVVLLGLGLGVLYIVKKNKNKRKK